MSNKKRKFLFPLIFIILLGILSYLVFKISYSIFITKSYDGYQGSINKYVSSINEINNFKFEEDLNEKTGVTLSKATEGKISQLITIKDKLSSLNPTEKYKIEHQNLIEGVSNNILIYRQIQGILSNPSGNDLDKSSIELKKYKSTTMENYKKAEKLIKISLSESFSNIVDKVISFSDINSKLNKENQIKNSQKQDFINGISDVISKFISIKKDFYTLAYNERNNKGGLGNVLVDISSNKNSFKDVKSSFSKISIPSSDVNKTYTSLKNLLASYDVYLQSISFAVNNEITKIQNSNQSIPSEEIDSIYSDSKLKYKGVEDNYSAFTTNLQNLKN